MNRFIAVTRSVSDAINDCELTHVARRPIDLPLARAQHREYEQALRDAGFAFERIEHTKLNPVMPVIYGVATVETP